jgi:hypothetical protein
MRPRGRVKLRPNRGFPPGRALPRHPPANSRSNYLESAQPKRRAFSVLRCQRRVDIVIVRTDLWGLTFAGEGQAGSPGGRSLTLPEASPYLRRGFPRQPAPTNHQVLAQKLPDF